MVNDINLTYQCHFKPIQIYVCTLEANATFLEDSTTPALFVMCFSPKSMQAYFSTLRNVWTDINTLVLNAKKCIYLQQFLHFSCFQPTQSPLPIIIGYFSVFGEHLSKGKKTRNGEQLKVEYILGI